MNGRRGAFDLEQILTTATRAKNKARASRERVGTLSGRYRVLMRICLLSENWELNIIGVWKKIISRLRRVMESIKNILVPSSTWFGARATKYANITNSPPT